VGSNGLQVTFIPTGPATQSVGWVDVHISITSSTVNGQFNYRLTETDSTHFTISLPTTDLVTVPQDAAVTYFFTYCSANQGGAHTDCNTDVFTVSRQPATGALVISNGNCPVIDFSSVVTRSSNPSQLSLTFHPITTGFVLGFVDVHVSINTALLKDGQGAYVPQYNYRLTKQANGDFSYTFPGPDGVSVPDTSYIQYFYTYCAADANGQRTDCNTDVQSFGAIQAQSKAELLLGDQLSSTGLSSTGTNSSESNTTSSSTGLGQISSTGGNVLPVSSSTGVSTSSGTVSSTGNNGSNQNRNGAAVITSSSLLIVALAIGSAVLSMNQ